MNDTVTELASYIVEQDQELKSRMKKKRQYKLDREKSMRLKPYTKNYMQLRKAGNERGS